MGMAGAARALTPIILDASGNFVQSLGREQSPANQQQGARQSQPLNTDQVRRDRNSNDRFSAGRSADQSAAEAARYQDRVNFDQGIKRGASEFGASLGNDVSNSNTARALALNAANALNEQYATAGSRLNEAANNSQRASNDAMATIAGLFR
jgi:hypothetical protein